MAIFEPARRKRWRPKKGRVVSQKPKPGKHLKHRAKVGLVVSKGQP
jgi:beta-lactam-binding protein with PASTA domain